MATPEELDFIRGVMRALSNNHHINAAGEKDALAADIIFAYRRGNTNPETVARAILPKVRAQPEKPRFPTHRKK